DLRQRGLDEEYAADIILAAVVGGLVGAKVWYVLLTGEWDALFRRGGFVWYGGFLGGVAAVLLNGWRRHVPPRWCVEPTAARHAVGWRFGVYLVLAGVERFLVEFVRAKDDRLLGPFTLAQATSALLVLVGIVILRRLDAADAAGAAVPAYLRPRAGLVSSN